MPTPNRAARGLLLLLLAVPTLARPDAPAAAAEPAPPAAASPSWSIGAGVSLGALFLSAIGALGTPTGYSAQRTSASVERALSPGRWLVVGVNGTAVSRDYDLPPGYSGTEGTDYAGLAVQAGLRTVLTPQGAPVELSLLAGAEAGGAWAHERSTASVGTRSTSAFRVAASVGLAAERALTDRLALRIASPIVEADLEWNKVHYTGVDDIHGRGFSVGLGLRPELQLRLTF